MTQQDPDRASAPVRVLLIGEYTIGHVPYVDALERRAQERPNFELTVMRLPYPPSGRLKRAPVYASNWSVRASVLARRAPAELWRRAEVALVHTQTASLLLRQQMRRVPTWLSTDATPANLDEVGAAYQHRVGPPSVEAAKRAVLRRAYGRAAGVIAWSSWAEQSLVEHYGVPASKVHVVRPGVELPLLPPSTTPRHEVRLLFVGGDFARKGGPELLQAFRNLRGRVTLDVVTHADLPPEPGVRVHRGLSPGSQELTELYRQADMAVLPTRGDASPYAVVEAMAFGLPVVTTAVGAVGEAVVAGVTGLLVPPADPLALQASLQQLVNQPDLRSALGQRGRQRACEDYDGRRNSDRVLDLLRDTALARRATTLGPAPHAPS